MNGTTTTTESCMLHSEPETFEMLPNNACVHACFHCVWLGSFVFGLFFSLCVFVYYALFISDGQFDYMILNHSHSVGIFFTLFYFVWTCDNS